MAERTGIAWSRSTFNPWIGCTEVSTEETGGGGCDGCYARERDKRHRYGGATHWGPGVPRHRTAAAYWREAEKWNEHARIEKETGVLYVRKGEEPWSGRVGFWPVFPSMCDPFDNEVCDGWHADFWRLIRATPHLTWLLLTKRVGLVEKMHCGEYPNVWIGASVVNQKEASRDIPKLKRVRGFAKRFISYEPALGMVDWCELLGIWWNQTTEKWERTEDHGIDQIIVGGESNQGKHRGRPFNIAWATATQRQCRAAGVAFFMKQFGADPRLNGFDGHPSIIGIELKDRAGADPAEWPGDLRVQEFPA